MSLLVKMRFMDNFAAMFQIYEDYTTFGNPMYINSVYIFYISYIGIDIYLSCYIYKEVPIMIHSPSTESEQFQLQLKTVELEHQVSIEEEEYQQLVLFQKTQYQNQLKIKEREYQKQLKISQLEHELKLQTLRKQIRELNQEVPQLPINQLRTPPTRYEFAHVPNLLQRGPFQTTYGVHQSESTAIEPAVDSVAVDSVAVESFAGEPPVKPVKAVEIVHKGPRKCERCNITKTKSWRYCNNGKIYCKSCGLSFDYCVKTRGIEYANREFNKKIRRNDNGKIVGSFNEEYTI